MQRKPNLLGIARPEPARQITLTFQFVTPNHVGCLTSNVTLLAGYHELAGKQTTMDRNPHTRIYIYIYIYIHIFARLTIDFPRAKRTGKFPRIYIHDIEQKLIPFR
jgi:hypothetical protein